MYISLGDLTPEEFGKRMNLELTGETVKFLKDHRCENADVPAGVMQLHIFDIPFEVRCGCIKMAQKFTDHMRNNYDLTNNGRACQVTYRQAGEEK
jgi:hypothetical protein